jgi:hypothetical protein
MLNLFQHHKKNEDLKQVQVDKNEYTRQNSSR